MAWSKIVGLEVSPVTDSSSIYRFNVPVSSRSRVMLSSQMLWPRLWSNCVAFIVSPRFSVSLARQHGFQLQRAGLGFTPQIPEAYSAMVRSLENFPEPATFRI